MKRALVLSGGGAKGAYQAGVVSALQPRTDEFPVVGGTSTGALISTMISVGAYDLMRLIYSGGVKTENIIRPIVLPEILHDVANIIKEPLVWLAAAAVAGEMGIYTIEPIIEIIDKEINFADIINSKINTYYATTEFTELKPKFYANWQKKSTQKLMREHLLASISMPIFMPPVRINRKYYTNGGVTQFLPAKYAHKAPRFKECDEIILIDTLTPEGSYSIDMPSNLPEMFLKTVDRMSDSLCIEQAKAAFKEIEDLTRMPVYRISPSKKLPIKFSLEFKPSEMKAAFEIGVEDGKKFISS